MTLRLSVLRGLKRFVMFFTFIVVHNQVFFSKNAWHPIQEGKEQILWFAECFFHVLSPSGYWLPNTYPAVGFAPHLFAGRTRMVSGYVPSQKDAQPNLPCCIYAPYGLMERVLETESLII